MDQFSLKVLLLTMLGLMVQAAVVEVEVFILVHQLYKENYMFLRMVEMAAML
jgi:hypothetical protein